MLSDYHIYIVFHDIILGLRQEAGDEGGNVDGEQRVYDSRQLLRGRIREAGERAFARIGVLLTMPGAHLRKKYAHTRSPILLHRVALSCKVDIELESDPYR